MMIIDYILDGKEFNMGYNLSTLSVIRMDRDPRNPGIDWGESNKIETSGNLLKPDLRRFAIIPIKV